MTSFSRSASRPFARSVAVVALLAAVATVAGCSSAPASEPASTASTAQGQGHGYVAGAEGASEAQLALALVDDSGSVTVRDLLSDKAVRIEGSGADTSATSVTGDGRFVYVVHGGAVDAAADSSTDSPSSGTSNTASKTASKTASNTTVQIVDTGVWTVNHEDHFHYYRADPAVIGEVEGQGIPSIESNDGHTAVLFASTGELALISHNALGKGKVEADRVQLAPNEVDFAVPFGGQVIVSAQADGGTSPDDSTPTNSELRVLSLAGEPVGDALAACPSPQGAVVTKVGLVASCADGAVLVTESGGVIDAQSVAYPAAIAARADTLDGRVGRPSVAGVARADDQSPPTPSGAWRFDAREPAWVWMPSDTRLALISAAADDQQLSVAVDEAGRVRVLDRSGTVVGQSEPLVAASLADDATRGAVRLIVEAQRAYVFGAAEGTVFEIDYRDGARVARTFDVGTSDSTDDGTDDSTGTEIPAEFMELVG